MNKILINSFLRLALLNVYSKSFITQSSGLFEFLKYNIKNESKECHGIQFIYVNIKYIWNSINNQPVHPFNNIETGWGD